MARKPRIEYEGAIYHVFNRGNYRTGLFSPAGAAQIFVDCLFEACERMHWRLHAYCLAQNEYHLALETPRGNLAGGIHWLQSTFGNRFNRFRGEPGRAFQGRYRAILTEPGAPLRELVDYIHLHPVRAKIVAWEQLPQFRWSSYRWFFRNESERPAALTCGAWQDGDGYAEHLNEMMLDEDRQKEAGFERMDKGWVRGSAEFRQRLGEDFERMTAARDWGGAGLAEMNRLEWQTGLEAGARALGRSLEEAASQPKSAAWKVALAAWLKRSTSVSNGWLAERLHMGPADAVSRYVAELRGGLRPAAAKCLEALADRN